jgi:phytoene desaturase
VRRVDGPTDRIVIVGAGLAGLSAALRLAGAGRQVTVVERDAGPGGRAGLREVGGYRFDTGPSVLTMPELIADALDAVGERLGDWLDLRPIDPAYRATFADGSTLDVHSDADAMSEEVARVCGSAEAAGYRRFVDFARSLYRAQMRDFVDRNFDSPLDLFSPNLARLVALGGFARLSTKVGQFVRDERLRRVFSFQALYAGLSPYQALALYAVISYMDCVAGVFFPAGGMHALPRALAAAAAKHGVTFRYGTQVYRVALSGRRAIGVQTSAGEHLDADAVVLTADLPTAYRELLPAALAPRRLRRLHYSPSCLLLLAGLATESAPSAHHTLHFGAAWRQTFDELVHDGQLMRDPSLLVSCPTRTDPALAPPGRSICSVLVPTPNLGAGLDWAKVGPAYREEIVARLDAIAPEAPLGSAIERESLTTPADWAEQGYAAGTPFSVAHTLAQTGPFRPANWVRGLDNVVLAGSGTVPGVGVPMALISGRLAAERISGPDPSYRSRAWIDADPIAARAATSTAAGRAFGVRQDGRWRPR